LVAVAEHNNDEVLRRLDLLIALTRVGVRDALIRESRALETDRVSAALLRSSENWTSAGELKKQAIKVSGQSEPTVKRRISELVSRGALLREGSGRTVHYRNSGLYEM
jgi:hypothetical protein